MPKSNEKIKLSDLRVGLFVLAALLVFAFLILNSSGSFSPFQKKLRLKARFENADGLHKNADVQLAGVSVGTVENVEFLTPSAEEEKDGKPADRIEATFLIAKELDNKPIEQLVRKDSTVQLIATSVLGNDKMINITPGSARAPAVNENDILESNVPISINQLTSTGNDLLEQFRRLSVPANEILNKANRGEGTLGRVVNDETLYSDLDTAVAETRETMKKLQQTIDTINTGKGSAGKLLKDDALYNSLTKTATHLETISADIRQGKGSAGKLVTDDEFYNDTKAAVTELRTAASKISAIADDVKLLTNDVRSGKGTAGKLFTDEKLYESTRDAVDRFNQTLSRIESVVTDAQNGKGTLGKVLTDETLYNNISKTAENVATFSGEGTKLLYDFRQNPKKFLRIRVTLF